MPSLFDPETWVARARKRARSAAQLQRDLQSIEGLRVVVEWCGARQLTVAFGKASDGTYFAASKEIVVNCRATPEHQLHILLHECGHHLVDVAEKTDRFANGWSAVGHVNRSSLHHRLDVLEEEFEAWHRGWKLGLKLGAVAPEDRPAFDATRIKMLASYARWVVKA